MVKDSKRIEGGGSFPIELESRARSITEAAAPRRWSLGSLSHLEREISLTLSNINAVQEIHDRVFDDLDRSETAVNTELLQMEERTPRYSPYRYPEREKLQRRIHSLEQERRRLKVSELREVRALHERLLSLLSQHAQLKGLREVK